MSEIVLLFFPGCPNAEAARRNLREALRREGLEASWRETNLEEEGTPAEWKGFGSPTVLVDGKDVLGRAPEPGGVSCRLYGNAESAPSVEAIAAALRASKAGVRADSDRWTSLAALPGLLASLLPLGACPACYPAYAAVLSSLGIGFLGEGPYLLPVTAGLLAVGVGALGWKAGRRRGYGPFFLGLAGALSVVGGRFLWNADPFFYGGFVALLVASLWNAWPRQSARAPGSCPACAGDSVRKGDPT